MTSAALFVRSKITAPLLVALVAVALCLPFYRYAIWMGDEGVLLHGADRLLRGEKLYLDFFEFLPPGGFFLTAAWLSVVGQTHGSSRALGVLFIAGIACFTYLACLRASRRGLLSAAIAIGWTYMSQRYWTQLNHHYLTTFYSLVSLWFVLRALERPRTGMAAPFWAGVMAGCAVTTTTTRGAFAVLAAAASLARRGRGPVARLLLGATVFPLLAVAVLAATGALGAALGSVFLRTASRYARIQYVAWGTDAGFQNFPLVWLFPLAGALLVLTCARGGWRASLRDEKLVACASFALAGFGGCFPRPDATHIAFAVPLVCPLLADCVARLLVSAPRRYALAALALAAACSLLPAAVYARAALGVLRLPSEPTPRGSVVLRAEADGERAALRRIAAAPPGAVCFFYPYMPMLAFLTGCRHAARHDIFMPGYTMSAEYVEACHSMMRDATWVVVDRLWTDPKSLQTFFPAMDEADPPDKRRFEAALGSGFELVERVGTFEILRRTPAASADLCGRVAF